MTSKRKILIMAGGTGGHIFPGLAVADHMKEQGWDISWLGTENRMEARLVPENGYKIHFIDVKGIRGNGLVTLLKAPFMILKSIWQAWKVIKQEKPQVILGMGGFASGPGGVAAWLSRTPLILHEQNAVAGFTNRMLARIADRVLVAFPNTLAENNSSIVVGNPVRRAIVSKDTSSADSTGQEIVEQDMAKRISQWQEAEEMNVNSALKNYRSINILVVGGSLGAKVFNDVLPSLLADLNEVEHCSIRHQTGKNNGEGVRQQYQQVLPNAEIQVDEFITDMADAYQWADLVICRSGALTVSEVAAAGVAAIFIPFPHAVDDHQTKNANWLVSCGAAKVIQQDEIANGELKVTLDVLLSDKSCLTCMGKKAASVAITDATEKVSEICAALARTS